MNDPHFELEGFGRNTNLDVDFKRKETGNILQKEQEMDRLSQ